MRPTSQTQDSRSLTTCANKFLGNGKYPYQRLYLPDLPGIYEQAKGRSSYDGDTITIELPLLGEGRIRLAGIQCPEIGEGGEAARDFVNEELFHAKEVWVWLQLPDDRDGDGRITLREMLLTASFSRWPGTVFVDGVDLRHKLLSRGLARTCY